MSTIFNIRDLKMPRMTRVSVIIGALVVVLAIVVAVVGWNVYKKLTTNTVVAYFPDTLALYAGDKVQIMGVKVGSIDAIEPAGNDRRRHRGRQNGLGPEHRRARRGTGSPRDRQVDLAGGLAGADRKILPAGDQCRRCRDRRHGGRSRAAPR